MIDVEFWKGRRVFLTGHTGFKGSWLSLWLHSLGADVTGYALEPPTNPSLYNLCQLDQLVDSYIDDIRNFERVSEVLQTSNPEIVIHMAAQPLVRDSYKAPLETYSTNVMGTVNLLEAVRLCNGVRAVVNVTTDKCYENIERLEGYREDEPLGGYDPYSNSKACSELVTSSYRNSFFNNNDFEKHGVAIASARAGNVIGGGDWAIDRLIPDCLRSFLSNKPVLIRNPAAIRPWQHVLEPLSGYLVLAEKLFRYGPEYAEAWNFGPNEEDAKPVEWIVREMCSQWRHSAGYEIDESSHPHEAHYLKLDCAKATSRLGWHSRWELKKALEQIVQWTQAYQAGQDLNHICREQIWDYLNS